MLLIALKMALSSNSKKTAIVNVISYSRASLCEPENDHLSAHSIVGCFLYSTFLVLLITPALRATFTHTHSCSSLIHSFRAFFLKNNTHWMLHYRAGLRLIIVPKKTQIQFSSTQVNLVPNYNHSHLMVLYIVR